MNFYDKLNELVRCFKDTTEYKDYIKTKNELKKDTESYERLKDFKEKQKENQIEYINGKKSSEDSQKEMQNLYSLVIQNELSRKLLENEMKIDVMLADLQKALGDGIKEIVEF